METRSVNKILISIAVIIAGIIPANAQVELQYFKPLVIEAVKHNKAIANAQLEQKKVLLDQEYVKGKFTPSLSANAMYGYVNSALNLDVPTMQTPILGTSLFDGTQQVNTSSQLAVGSLTASQVIFSGLQITKASKALAEKAKAQQLMIESNYDVIAQDVTSTLDQLMLLKEVDLLILDSEKRLNKEHEKLIKGIENGLAIPYDRDKMKLAILELESKKAEIQSSRSLLYYKLQDLTGLSLDELKSFDYKLFEITFAMDKASQMNRKELEALQTSQHAYQYILEKEKAARLPQVFAFANLSYFNAFNSDITLKDIPKLGDLKLETNHLRLAPSYAVGIGLKWNILEGKTHKTSVGKAKLDMEMNANKLQDTQDKLALLQKKVISDYDLANVKIKVNKQQITIANNNLNLAYRQFEEGLIDVTERLEAENEYYKQSLNYYNQLLNQRLAAMEVLKVNGNLYQTILN